MILVVLLINTWLANMDHDRRQRMPGVITIYRAPCAQTRYSIQYLRQQPLVHGEPNHHYFYVLFLDHMGLQIILFKPFLSYYIDFKKVLVELRPYQSLWSRCPCVKRKCYLGRKSSCPWPRSSSGSRQRESGRRRRGLREYPPPLPSCCPVPAPPGTCRPFPWWPAHTKNTIDIYKHTGILTRPKELANLIILVIKVFNFRVSNNCLKTMSLVIDLIEDFQS